MNHTAGTDTTAHRYYRPSEIAAIVQSLDRGFAIALDREPRPRDWDRLPQPQQLEWIAVVDEYRSGTTPRQLYEARSGEPWSSLERDDQIRLEMGHLLVTGLASVQR